MKRAGILTGLYALAFLLPMVLMAQEKPPAPPPPPPKVTPLKVEVTVEEYDGAKKVSSLPYTFHVAADDPQPQAMSQIRVGLRVPIYTGTGGAGGNQFQYMDVGTNVDCLARSALDGRFRLQLSIERSYLYSVPGGEKKNVGSGEGMAISSGNPVIARLNTNYNLYVRDGQPVEGTSTTDPISGHVLKVNVTVNVVK